MEDSGGIGGHGYFTRARGSPRGRGRGIHSPETSPSISARMPARQSAVSAEDSAATIN
jgi:hypothetical protein